MRIDVIAVVVLGIFYSPAIATRRDHSPHQEHCRLCILQRPSKISYIFQRAINEKSGPDENDTFGHCFFCVQCPGDILPSCWGWWPADPQGGDYVGDEGRLQPDRKESWNRAACIGLSEKKAISAIDMLEEYEQKNSYQVLNEGGRSCLGFCEDIAGFAGLEVDLPLGDYTPAGNMRFPSAPLSFTNPQEKPVDDLMFFLVEAPSYPLSDGDQWPSFYQLEQ